MAASKYQKLIVDNRPVYVFDSENMPAWIERLLNFTGIELQPANKLDRQPFLDLENKLQQLKENNRRSQNAYT